MKSLAVLPTIPGFRIRHAANPVKCSLCQTPIEKGQLRYVGSIMNVCTACVDVWITEGGMLYQISRSKIKNGFQIQTT